MRRKINAQILFTLLMMILGSTVAIAQENKCSGVTPRDGDWTAVVRACSMLLEQSGNVIVTDRYGNTSPKGYILVQRANAYAKLNQLDKAIDDLNAAASRDEVLSQPGQAFLRSVLGTRDDLLKKQIKQAQIEKAGSCIDSDVVQSFSKAYKLFPAVTIAHFGDQRRCSVRAEVNPCIKSAMRNIDRYSQFKRIDKERDTIFRFYELTSSLIFTYEQDGSVAKNVKVTFGGATDLDRIVMQRGGPSLERTGAALIELRTTWDALCVLGEARDDNDFAVQFQKILPANGERGRSDQSPNISEKNQVPNQATRDSKNNNLSNSDRKIAWYTMGANTDLPGNDINSTPFKTNATEDCAEICLRDPNCKAFTFNASAKGCFIKYLKGAATFFAGAESGYVVGR